MDRGAWRATVHGSQRVRHDCMTNTHIHTHTHTHTHTHNEFKSKANNTKDRCINTFLKDQQFISK